MERLEVLIVFLLLLFTTENYGQEKRRVAIDPGHGGKDYIGAVFKDSQNRVILIEKELNLQVAKILQEILVSRDYEVVLTREDDYFLTSFQKGNLTDKIKKEIQTRIDLVNQKKADILISIHFNGDKNPKMRGTKVYYNAHRPFSKKNRRLAETIQKNIITKLKETGYQPIDLGIKTDETKRKKFDYPYSFLLGDNPGFGRPSQMPGVIVETLYLTNPKEAKLLKNPQILKIIAQALAQGIEEYFVKKLK